MNNIYKPEFIPLYLNVMDEYGLTQSQGALYWFIRFYTQKNQFYFNSEDIWTILNTSPWTVDNMVSKLKQLKLITTITHRYVNWTWGFASSRIIKLCPISLHSEDPISLQNEGPISSCDEVKENIKRIDNIKPTETVKAITNKVVNVKVRDHMLIVNEYETEGTYNIDELASKAVVNAYELPGLNSLAIVFLDYYCANKDKLEWKVNIKARFNKFVQTDYHGLLTKKSEWPGIDTVTDEEFLALMEAGHFKTSTCKFYKTKVRPHLDTQWINTFQLMIEFFRNKDIWEKKWLRFKERLVATKKIIG